MRRATTMVATCLCIGLLADGAAADSGALAAPGPCAEPRVELRGRPISALDLEEGELRNTPIGPSAKVGRPQESGDPTESPVPPFDAEERELRDSPIPPLTGPGGPVATPAPPLNRSGPGGESLPPQSDPGGSVATPVPPGNRGGPDGEPTPSFDVSGGPLDHFDPKDVAADPRAPRAPRPPPPTLAARTCDLPGVCSAPTPGPLSIISEPKPNPFPGDPF